MPLFKYVQIDAFGIGDVFDHDFALVHAIFAELQLQQLEDMHFLVGIMIFLGVFLVSFKRGSLNKSLGVIEE